MVKGLAKFGNRGRHGRWPSLLTSAPFRKGGYSPVTGAILRQKAGAANAHFICMVIGGASRP